MPRANRRRDDGAPLDLGRATAGVPGRAEYAGRDWFVRPVAGARGDSGDLTRAYRCPGCQQEVGAQAHVVAWPAEGVGGADHRRHWHTRCWANRHTRPPQGSYR
ncbi:MAG: hypothetical protein IPJ15_00600 [Actinomycetales bacterium]|nr:hypothetical protein [Candidatus Phosphoribacter baldrii]